jgi:hypothetical protein
VLRSVPLWFINRSAASAVQQVQRPGVRLCLALWRDATAVAAGAFSAQLSERP